MLETPLFMPPRAWHEGHERSVAEVVRVARRILMEIDDVAEQTAALRGGGEGVVRMAAVGGAITGLLAAALPEFARFNLGSLLQLQEADPTAMPALLARGESISRCGAVPAGRPADGSSRS
jgi:hypothetical protein